jgi:hypothetical protein
LDSRRHANDEFWFANGAGHCLFDPLISAIALREFCSQPYQPWIICYDRRYCGAKFSPRTDYPARQINAINVRSTFMDKVGDVIVVNDGFD